MKKHTRVLSFIAFCIVLGALPIVGGCQSRSSTDRDWWTDDFSDLKMKLNYIEKYDFKIDDSITHLFDTGTIIWDEKVGERFSEDRLNGQIIHRAKYGQWEYYRYENWATYRINGYDTLFFSLPTEYFPSSLFAYPNYDGLLASLNNTYLRCKDDKSAKQQKILKLPAQPDGLRKIGKLKYEKYQITKHPEYSSMGFWILTTPHPTVIQVEYTGINGETCKEGLVYWSPGLHKKNVASKQSTQKTCLIAYPPMYVCPDYDVQSIIPGLLKVQKNIILATDIEKAISFEIAVETDTFLNFVKTFNASSRKETGINPPQLLIPEKVSHPWSFLSMILSNNAGAFNFPVHPYIWEKNKKFIAITYGIPETPSPTILFLQRKAKPEDQTEWTLREEAVTINDGQVVKLLHLTGVKDSFYCDLIGHDATEAQLREMQAQLILCQPKNRNNELFQGMK